MTEAQFSQRLRRELKAQLPDAMIFKHNDHHTGGIPDFSLTYERKTTWVEVKLAGNRIENSPLQLETMRRLGRAAYVVWDAKSKLGDVFWVDHSFGQKCYFPFAMLVETLVSVFIKAE